MLMVIIPQVASSSIHFGPPPVHDGFLLHCRKINTRLKIHTHAIEETTSINSLKSFTNHSVPLLYSMLFSGGKFSWCSNSQPVHDITMGVANNYSLKLFVGKIFVFWISPTKTTKILPLRKLPTIRTVVLCSLSLTLSLKTLYIPDSYKMLSGPY